MQLICPACGAACQLDDDSDASYVICGNCGKRLSSRSILNPQGVSDPAPAIDLLADVLGQSNTIRPLAPMRPTPPRRSFNWPILVMVLIGLGSLMGAFAYLVASQNSAATEQATVAAATATADQSAEHRAEILRLKSLAADAAVNGDLHDAYERYQRLAKFAADKPSTDPVVVSAVAEARAEQAKVFSLLMERQHTTTASAPVVTQAPPEVTPSVVPAINPTAAASATNPVATATTQPVNPVPAIAPGNPADSQPALAGVTPGPRSVRAYSNDNGVTDAEVGEAIVKGILFLKSQFKNGVVQVGQMKFVGGPRMGGNPFGRFGGPFGGGMRGLGGRGFGVPPGAVPGGGTSDVSSITGAAKTDGFDALAAYALLHAGQATDGKYMQKDDPFTEQMLETLKQMDMPYTYWRSLRASALAVLNRVQDKAALEADVAWLVKAHRNGGYTYLSYEDRRTIQSSNEWDNSNSQYGLLGVWSGAEADTSVPSSYWTQVATHWTTTQLPDGRWSYQSDDSTPRLSMTLAGVASELVCSDYQDQSAGNGHGKMTPAEEGLSWLDTGDNCTSEIADNQWHGYVLYGLERVGLASGYKYFGSHDWYSEFARSLVAAQNGDGSWGERDPTSSVMETAYFLLFLARGRHPILYNHIRYNGAWNTHPRAISHLAKYAAKSLERPLNWQVVNFARPWYDWMDSPVLYLSGTDAPKLTDADYQQLQAFANGGGLIFTHADNNSPVFNQWVDRLVRKIFPQYEFSQLPKDHPIYSTVYPIKLPPTLKVVSNGSRILLVHSPHDIAEGWQANWTDNQKTSFQMGINLFVYAAGKANFKNRLSSSYLPPFTATPTHTYPVARLRYGGHWDPEPYAWTRFARYFSFDTRAAIDEKQIAFAEVTPAMTPLAVLTGTVRNDFTDAEISAARRYVDGGGVLLIDACGGRSEFSKSVTQLIARAFPDGKLSDLPENHPLLLASRPDADDLRKPLLRPYAIQTIGRSLPLMGFAHGKGHVIFSRLDITTGLLGTNQWGILGYDPNYASSLMKNAVLWTAARAALRN